MKNWSEADVPAHYFRLPGGIDLFLHGYVHHRDWHQKYGPFLRAINKHAKVIAIEGFADKPFGESMDLRWSGPEFQTGDYDALMHEAVDAGFSGLFTEIDARDRSRINLDKISELPPAFFEKYFTFLQREAPTLAEQIGSPPNLKKMLIEQSTTEEGLLARQVEVYMRGIRYSNYPYVSKGGEVSSKPTFLELGEFIFTDALATIKLHQISKLMADGHIERGPIIDYCGSFHLNTRSFFLRYPSYAMEIVLRHPHILMAGRVKDLDEIYGLFDDPDWSEIVKEIARLVFRRVLTKEDAPL